MNHKTRRHGDTETRSSKASSVHLLVSLSPCLLVFLLNHKTRRHGDEETRSSKASSGRLPVSLSPCLLFFLLVIGQKPLQAEDPPPRVVVGSKAFTESVILAELATQLARRTDAEIVHRPELGGTRLLWNSLRQGEIDVYPEYTGTLS